jgi:ferrous iron transport protein B
MHAPLDPDKIPTGAVLPVGVGNVQRTSRTVSRRIALVGNPNVGKSVIFGALTGTYATVSNYPGTTVEVVTAAARFDPRVQVTDTPGVNSLTPHSEDERVTRDILLEGIDLVVQVADAKNVARALVLSLQLAEAQIPFVLVLNMMDEAADRGITVDIAGLSRALGVPVIPTVAVSGRGLAALREALRVACTSHWRVDYPEVVEQVAGKVEAQLSGFAVGARWLALMCLTGDTTLRPWLMRHLAAPVVGQIEGEYRALRRAMPGSVGYQINRWRRRAAEDLARTVTAELPANGVIDRVGQRTWQALGLAAFVGCLALLAGDLGVLPFFAAPTGRVLGWLLVASAFVAAWLRSEMRHAVGAWASRQRSGLAVLFVVLYLMYRFVGVLAAGTAVNFVEHVVFGKLVNPLVTAAVDHATAAIGSAGGLSAGAAQLIRDMLVGPYGLVTVAFTYAFAIIFPIVTAFFLAFSVLEDSGYLPRLAVVVNRAFRAMGLNGKAVLPMVLGLGCDTMATLTARIMETRKERVLVTLLLALGVPCSAQLGVILGLFGALPAWAALVWGGVVIGVLFAVGFLAARLLPGEASDLILEIPPIRRPQLGNVVIKTVGRLEWYLKEAVPIFVLGTFVLFVLDTVGVLQQLVRACQPAVVGVLDLPPKAAEAFLIGFFRRDYGSAGIYALFQQGLLSPVQAVVALVTITLFVPCVANFFVIVKEQGLRVALAMTAFIFPFAILVGGAVNFVLRSIGLG